MNFITMDSQKKYDIKKFLLMEKFISENEEKINSLDTLIWVYKLTNIKENKIYIGKTKNIYRRATEYITEYKNKNGKKRSIWKVIQEYGIENFIMEPIYVTDNPNDAARKELFYIEKLDSMNPEKGYNDSYQSVITPDHINYKIRYQKADEKMRRSKLFISINPIKKEIVISTGLKLFGDTINRKKDEVKSAAKRCCSLDGYYLYYLNNDDFQSQILFAKDKVENNKDKDHRYQTFLDIANIVINTINNKNIPNDFNLKFIFQNDNINGFTYADPEIFFNFYNSFIERKMIKPLQIP